MMLRTKRIMAVLLLLPLAACEDSVDERFARMCAEHKKFGGELEESSRGLCNGNAQYISPAERETIVDMWETMKRHNPKYQD